MRSSQFLYFTSANKGGCGDIIYGWSTITGAAAIVSGDRGERKGENENGEERMNVEEKSLKSRSMLSFLAPMQNK